MEKYKVCPHCGKHNPPKLLECIQCETDLSNVRVIDEEIEQRTENNNEPVVIDMTRICDCGFHNPVNARKCENCGEDISDIIPVEEHEKSLVHNRYTFASLDGEYAYEIVDSTVIIGREAVMQEYLGEKPYVSRKHAELSIDNELLFIENLSETNYTYVNNERIPEGKYELHDGDEVGLGGKLQNGSRQEEAAYFLVRIGQCI